MASFREKINFTEALYRLCNFLFSLSHICATGIDGISVERNNESLRKELQDASLFYSFQEVRYVNHKKKNRANTAKSVLFEEDVPQTGIEPVPAFLQTGF
jgi:hypothetical protein